MFKQAFSLFAVLALSGCAVPLDEEGDEDLGSVEDEVAVAGDACTNPSADAKLVKAAVDSVRTKAGMKALDCNDKIRTAAMAHANYLHHNNGDGHVEVQGKTGFYAERFPDRMAKAGFTGPAAFEVIGFAGKGDEVINGRYGWMNTVFHRVPFVDYATRSYGFGNYVSGATKDHGTIDFSWDGVAAADNAISTWPKKGDTGLWSTFDCTLENPNPCDANYTEVGYPISITGGGMVELNTHTIKGGGATIAHWYRTQAYNEHIPNTQVYLLPKKPLATNTTYTVSVTGKVSGTAFSRTWSFKTGAI